MPLIVSEIMALCWKLTQLNKGKLTKRKRRLPCKNFVATRKRKESEEGIDVWTHVGTLTEIFTA